MFRKILLLLLFYSYDALYRISFVIVYRYRYCYRYEYRNWYRNRLLSI